MMLKLFAIILGIIFLVSFAGLMGLILFSLWKVVTL